MESTHYLIKAYYKLDYSNLKAINSLIGDIEAHLAEHGPDTKLELALHAITARKEDGLNSGFDKVCETAKFVVDKLKDRDDWDIVEFDIFCSVLGRIQCYELTISMMEKCLDMLERNFKNLPDYEYTKGRIFGEMAYRLMRAKFYDSVEPKKLEKLFDTCVKSTMQVCEKLGLVALRTNLLVREAIFNENPAKIFECIKAMEATDDKYWIKSSKDEAVEYVRFFGIDAAANLNKFMFGWQVKKRRKELGLSTLEFAGMIDSTQSAVTAIERGTKGTGTKRFYAIMKALQVQNPSYFFGEPLVSARAIAKDVHEYQAMQFISGMSEKTKDAALDFLKKFVDLDKNK